ncbi:MAG: S8 family serine peptidase [Bacteroidota bacterium]|nr:S8 family serine peptidase [Bacteroidota bacterium]
MKRKLLYLLVLFCVSVWTDAAEDLLRYRVLLKDKHDSTLVGEAVPALSEKALNRRVLHKIQTDSTDFPLSRQYLNSLNEAGFKVVSGSRWMNSVVVSIPDSSRLERLKAMPFVRSVRLVWVNPLHEAALAKRSGKLPKKYDVKTESVYGKALKQVDMLMLEPLHTAGFRGQGKCIAVVDAGFYHVNSLPWFNQLNLVTARDMIYPPSDIFEGHYHGMSVLSIMAADSAYVLTGTAPDAAYCLLRSEDVNSESPIEEDYWVAAVELADSIGADIVTCSLGYTAFDTSFVSHTLGELDGRTAFISQAAGKAVEKGLLVVVSAGNDGNSDWKKIDFPADVDGVLTVGAVASDGSRSSFSSIGPTADGRIKPDVVALGAQDIIVSSTGAIASGSGTSYAAPLITGMAACLWQAFPDLSAQELIRLIKQSCSMAAAPDTFMGYGLPNAYKCWLSLQNDLPKQVIPEWYCYPNPTDNQLYLANFSGTNKSITCIISDLAGEKKLQTSFSGQFRTVDVSFLPSGLYLVEFYSRKTRLMSQKILIKHA